MCILDQSDSIPFFCCVMCIQAAATATPPAAPPRLVFGANQPPAAAVAMEVDEQVSGIGLFYTFHFQN